MSSFEMLPVRLLTGTDWNEYGCVLPLADIEQALLPENSQPRLQRHSSWHGTARYHCLTLATSKPVSLHERLSRRGVKGFAALVLIDFRKVVALAV